MIRNLCSFNEEISAILDANCVAVELHGICTTGYRITLGITHTNTNTKVCVLKSDRRGAAELGCGHNSFFFLAGCGSGEEWKDELEFE